MPKRLGPKRLGPKRLGAEASRGRNGLVPKRLVTERTTLYPYFLFYTVVQQKVNASVQMIPQASAPYQCVKEIHVNILTQTYRDGMQGASRKSFYAE